MAEKVAFLAALVVNADIVEARLISSPFTFVVTMLDSALPGPAIHADSDCNHLAGPAVGRAGFVITGKNAHDVGMFKEHAGFAGGFIGVDGVKVHFDAKGLEKLDDRGVVIWVHRVNLALLRLVRRHIEGLHLIVLLSMLVVTWRTG